MSPVLITNHQGAPNIDPGSYIMELTGVRQVQVDDFDHPETKVDRVEVTFRVLGYGSEFSDLATPRLGPRSKLGQIMTALNGGASLPDGDIDLEDFVGKRLQATVRLKNNGYNQIIAETAVPVDAGDWEETD